MDFLFKELKIPLHYIESTKECIFCGEGKTVFISILDGGLYCLHCNREYPKLEGSEKYAS